MRYNESTETAVSFSARKGGGIMSIKLFAFLVLAIYTGFILLPLLAWLGNGFVNLLQDAIDEAEALWVRVKLFAKLFRFAR